MTHSRYSFAKVPIGNLDQDSSEEEAVQDMIRRTLESLDNDDHDSNDFEDAGYGTDDSWDVTRRRWARNKRDDMVTVRRHRRPVVNRGKALANLPGVPWPLGNQDDIDSQDDDDEEVAALSAEQTRQRTVEDFRSKVRQLSKDVSQVSPDSVWTFALANRAQQVHKSTITTVADVTTTPSRGVAQESHYPSSPSSPRRHRRRRYRPDCNTNRLHSLDLDMSLVQHVDRARASVISTNTNTRSTKHQAHE